VVDIAVKYTGAPKDAIKHGNDRLKFTTILDEPGLSLLADELVAQKNIQENPGAKLYAEEFRGITWDLPKKEAAAVPHQSVASVGTREN
jgi:NitT/TauT family transport system substrate-binding protein